jgi:crotonobetainyl-CoA:carnitine CoA-transferase CaiB-like acyl-CoA transferase
MKVLELARTPAAAYAGLLLAQLGAEVLSVELPDADLDPAIERYVNRYKHRSVSVEEVQDVDGVIEDLGPGGLEARTLSPKTLRARHPNVVVVRISPFGQSGPHADWQASELVVQAMGGILQATGWDGEPPMNLAGPMAAFIAGLHAAIAMFAAVHGVQSGSEPGVDIDISAQETFLQHWWRHIGQWSYSGAGQWRDRRTLDGQGVPSLARAADGWICLAVRNARWNTVAGLLGLDDFTGEEWQTPAARVQRWSEVAPTFASSMASRTREEWFAAAAERGLIFGPVHDLQEVLDSQQYAARGYFDTDADHLKVPGLPFTQEE